MFTVKPGGCLLAYYGMASFCFSCPPVFCSLACCCSSSFLALNGFHAATSSRSFVRRFLEIRNVLRRWMRQPCVTEDSVVGEIGCGGGRVTTEVRSTAGWTSTRVVAPRRATLCRDPERDGLSVGILNRWNSHLKYLSSFYVYSVRKKK